MQMVIQSNGQAVCIYSEVIDLAGLGLTSIRRASHVEPTVDGLWTADLSPVNGPLLGPFSKRSDALAAEIRWLESNLPP